MGLSRLTKILSFNSIGLDANVYIYALNNDTRFQVAIDLLDSVRLSNSSFVTSVITLTEFVIPLYLQDVKSRLQKYINFVSGNGLIDIVDIDKEIALKAAQLRAKYNLKTPDALHLATAICRGCQIFVTADRGFTKKIKEIIVEVI